ncbi:MAG: hypothetical protein ACHQ6V_14145 [Myxococcota bacterium]
MATSFDFRRESSIERRDAGFGHAFERVYEAGHELVARRLELGAAEARMLARSGVALLCATVVGLTGWLYLVAGVVDALARDHPRFAVELGVGAAHVAVAFALLAIAQRAAPKRGDAT